MNLLLLAGRRNAGKSTAARYLERRFDALALAMSAPLKDLVGPVFGFPHEVLYGSSARRDLPAPQFKHARAWDVAGERLRRKADPWLTSLNAPCALRARSIALDRLDLWFDGMRDEALLPGGAPLTARRALQTLGTEFGRAVLGPDVWVEHAIDTCRRADREARLPLYVIEDGRFENEIDAVHRAGGKVLLIDAPAEHGSEDTHASERGLDAVPPEKFDTRRFNAKTGHDAFHIALYCAALTLFPDLE